MSWSAAFAFLVANPAILAALLTFVLTVSWQLVTRVFAPQPKLIWGVTRDSTLLVPWTPPPSEHDPVPAPRTLAHHVRSIWLWNGGRGMAEDVELLFNWRPPHMERFPQLKAEETTFPDNRFLLTLERVNPREGINFNLLSAGPELPLLIHVRCKGFPATEVTFINQRRFPNWINAIVAALMLLGLAAALYLLIIVVLQFVPLTAV